MPEKKTVAIVGSHIKTRLLAPFNNPSIDIWAFNESASVGWLPRADAMFQMHAEVVWRNPVNRNDTDYPKWMSQAHPFPIYMLEKHADVPASVKYPLDTVCAHLLGRAWKGEKPLRYFTSSVAYALALAIHHKYKRIELYGVEMSSDTEYSYQRDGVFFWLGIAVGRGIEIIIHPEAELFAQGLYGYEGGATMQRPDFIGRAGKLTVLRDEAEKRLQAANDLKEKTLAHALEASDGEPGMAPVVDTKQFFTSLKAQAQAIVDLGALSGALEEVNRYLRKCDAMEQAAGTHWFARQEFEITAAQARDGMHQFEANMHLQGATANTAWEQLQKEVQNEAPREVLDEKSETYGKAHGKYLEAAYQYGGRLGKLNENLEYLRIIDERIKQAGGEKAAEAIVAALELEKAAVA